MTIFSKIVTFVVKKVTAVLRWQLHVHLHVAVLQWLRGGGMGVGGGGVGPVVRALQDSGLIKRSWFRACWGHYVVFLGRILYLLVQCLTLSRCINGYLHI